MHSVSTSRAHLWTYNTILCDISDSFQRSFSLGNIAVSQMYVERIVHDAMIGGS